MATFTITATQNIDALVGKTGGDVYNINWGTLIVDQDSRFGLNNNNSSATAATTFGNITISATLWGILDVDARYVRIIPYDTWAWNVPTSNTVISQGWASWQLICVMTSLTATPTASWAAMPATGFIKIKAWNSTEYSAWALTGISANATGASTVWFIELVWDDAGTLNVPRLWLARFRWEWYNLGTTNGTANQQFQIPTQGIALRYFPWVYIETSVGSNTYEFYPNAWSQTTVATDIRAKVVWISTWGLVRIWHNGTANAWFLPVTWLKVVIPNIILQNCTTAARNANVLPNASLATRYDFTTTGGWVVEMDKVASTWYLSFAQAFSVTLTNTCTNEQISVSEIASPMNWSNVGVGQSAAQAQSALLKSLCFAGGTFTNCVWSRATLASSGSYTNSITDVTWFTYVFDRSIGLTVKWNATSGNWVATRAVNCTWTSPILVNGRMVFATCTNIAVNSWNYVDVITWTTATTAAQNSYVFELSANTNGFTSTWWAFLGLTNVQPYLGILSIAAAWCANVKLRSIGTRSSPLSLGSVNNAAYLFVLATWAAASDVKIQRCYVSNTRTWLWTWDNSSTRITLEKVFGDYADAPVTPTLNTLIKWNGATYALTAQTAVYGTHYHDYFTSTTAWRIAIVMNEATSLTSSQITLENNANFTSAGGLYMPTIWMAATFEMSYYALGHTWFQNSALVMAGGTVGNYRFEYAIDKNDGAWFSTMTSSSFTAAWLGTALNGITGIDASKGIKLKLKITTTTTNTTAITSVYVLTNSSTTAQDYEYPLDIVTLTLTWLVTGSDIVIYEAGTTTILAQQEDNSGTTYSYTYELATTVDIWVFLPWYIPFYIRDYNLSSSNSSLPIAQVADRAYLT